MKLTGNTILITGSGSGIGRGLAEAFHKRGNTVIIAGRRPEVLDETVRANPGLRSVVMDVADPESIACAAAWVIEQFPALNVVINNAGVMYGDTADGPVDEDVLLATVTINLMGPVRVASAFVEHLKTKPAAAIVHVSSVLAFVPLAAAAVYSATKAALHSYALSQRHRLRGSAVEVIEIVPPRVATDLMDGHADPMAMPLEAYVTETMAALASGGEEVLIERTRVLRDSPGADEHAFVAHFNDAMADH